MAIFEATPICQPCPHRQKPDAEMPANSMLSTRIAFVLVVRFWHLHPVPADACAIIEIEGRFATARFS